MTDDLSPLDAMVREALGAEADRAPDAGSVMRGVQRQLRRRRTSTVAGAAAVGVTVAAAVTAVGLTVPTSRQRVSVPALGAAGRSAPVVSPTPSATPSRRGAGTVFTPPPQWAVFYGAGYTVSDARRLARLWHVSLGRAKVIAGNDIAHGKPLPITPSSSPTVTSQSDADSSGQAAELARLWTRPTTVARISADERRQEALEDPSATSAG